LLTGRRTFLRSELICIQYRCRTNTSLYNLAFSYSKFKINGAETVQFFVFAVIVFNLKNLKIFEESLRYIWGLSPVIPHLCAYGSRGSYVFEQYFTAQYDHAGIV